MVLAVTKVFQKRTGRSLESIGKRVVEIVGVLGDVQEGVLALTEKETLEWLCPSKDDTSTERHNTIGETIDNGVPGNPGDVFVQKPEYRDWTTDPGQKVLWLHAPCKCFQIAPHLDLLLLVITFLTLNYAQSATESHGFGMSTSSVLLLHMNVMVAANFFPVSKLLNNSRS